MPKVGLRLLELTGLAAHLPCVIQTLLFPDQQLVLAYARAQDRDVLTALFQIDAHLGAMALSAREPMVTRIKLAWWQEQGFAKARPVNDLDDAIRQIEVRVPGCHGLLAQLAEGWGVFLEFEEEGEASLNASAELRGPALFGLAAAAAGVTLTEAQKSASIAWALVDLARKCGSDEALAKARDVYSGLHGTSQAMPVRILSLLSALARNDAARGLNDAVPLGSPLRIVRTLWFFLTRR